jgi:hypothetical protein
MKYMTRTVSVWRWSSVAALFASALVIVQDVLYGGLPTETPFGIAIAQYALPWFTWAALAPLILILFIQLPIDLRRPWWPLGGYVVISILIVGLKLVITVPVTALLIWQPLGVATADGVRWLLAHRATPNLITFWLFLAAYTGYRYYRLAGQTARAEAPADPLNRIPVRIGDRTRFVSLEEVSHIETERNQLTIYTSHGQHGLHSTLQDLEARLPAQRFLRIHRSRLVNVDRIDAVEPWGRGDYVLIMKNGQRLISGKTYRDAIRRILHISQS